MSKTFIAKKLYLTVVLFFVIVSIAIVFPHKVSAQSSTDYFPATPYINNIFRIQSEEENMQFYGCSITSAGGAVGAFAHAIETGIAGLHASTLDCALQKGDIDAAFNELNGGQDGILGKVNSINATLLDQRPTSTQNYIGEKIYALQHIGEVNAASDPGFYFPGTGYQLLKPIQSIWGWSVNVVYGLMILVIVFVAFAIMFRDRLSGFASVTIQSAIPNIAIAMILIPLSYAISGLFIDAVTVGTNVVHEFLIGSSSPANQVYKDANTSGSSDGSNDRGLYPDDTRIDLWHAYQFETNCTTDSSGVEQCTGLGSKIQAFASGSSTLTSIASVSTPSSAVTSLIQTVFSASWIASIINVLLAILLLLTSIRIFWLLLNKMAVFILFPVFAPFVFATIAIPGNGTKAIMQYMKTMASGSAFFIVTYAMLLLSWVLSSQSLANVIPAWGVSGYVPPLLGLQASGIITSDSKFTALILSILALAVYLNIPGVLKGLDESWGTKLTIPKFFSNAVGSAKESINLGKRIYNAPGTALTNVQKRVFGVQEGDYRAYKNVIGRGVSRFSSWADARAERANPLLRGVLNPLARGASAVTKGAVGSAVSGEEAGKPKKLAIKFAWNGGENEFVIDDAVISQLMHGSVIPVSNGGQYVAIKGPKLSISAEGMNLPPLLSDRTITIRTALPEGTVSGSKDYRRRAVPTNRAFSSTNRGPQAAVDYISDITGDLDVRNDTNAPIRIVDHGILTSFFGENIAVLVFDGPPFPSESNRKKGDIGLLFAIPIPATIPGGLTPIQAAVSLFATNVRNRFLKSGDVALRIDFTESNAANARINPSFVNNAGVVDNNTGRLAI